ncbi:unnamed protein product, partial [Tetraodon nigroviridis]
FAIFAFSTCGGYSGMFPGGGGVQEPGGGRSVFRCGVRVPLPTPPGVLRRPHPVRTGTDSASSWWATTPPRPSSSSPFGVFDSSSTPTAALSIYVFFFEKYKENNKGPLIDLGVTGVFAFMWLVSSAAWAKGLSDVKKATDPDVVITMIRACDEESKPAREVH